MPRRVSWLGLFCLFLIVSCEEGSRPTALPTENSTEAWTTIDGEVLIWSDLSRHRAAVLIFLGLDCPISNAYAPEMGRLYQEFSPQGVMWIGIHSDADVEAGEARRHAQEYGLSFPIVLDSDRSLARRFGARKIPEAVVLSPSEMVMYRGRIDDRYYDLGRSRGEPQQRDLRDAIRAVVAGNLPKVSHAPAIGCDIDLTHP